MSPTFAIIFDAFIGLLVFATLTRGNNLRDLTPARWAVCIGVSLLFGYLWLLGVLFLLIFWLGRR